MTIRPTDIATALVALLLLGGALAFVLLTTTADDRQIAHAKRVASSAAYDPASAVYAEMRVLKARDGATLVCGTIDTKTRPRGGYIGARPFVYNARDGSVLFTDCPP